MKYQDNKNDSGDIILHHIRLLLREQHNVLLFGTRIIRVLEISHFLDWTFFNPESIRDFELSMNAFDSNDETWRIVSLSQK